MFVGNYRYLFTLSMKSNIDVPCMTIQKFHCLCIWFSRFLFYFQLIRQKRHHKKKGGVKSKLTSHILILRDMKLMKEMQRPFLWIAKKPGALLKLVRCSFQYTTFKRGNVWGISDRVFTETKLSRGRIFLRLNKRI